MADQQRISYVPLEDMTPEMRAEMERCAREGTPRPESSAIRAHVPAAFWFFANSWQRPVPRGRPRARAQGAVPRLHLALGQVRVLRQPALREGPRGSGSSRASTTSCSTSRARRRSASARRRRSPTPRRSPGASTPTTRSGSGCTRTSREPELVELGCMIGLTLGQQSWLRMLNIEHHEVHGRRRRVDGARVRDRRGARARARPSDDYWARDAEHAPRRRSGTSPTRAGVHPATASRALNPALPGRIARARPRAGRARRRGARLPARSRRRAACARAAPGSSASSSPT